MKTVGIKMGEQGCYVRAGGEEYLVPPFCVEAVDANGAGDAWVAGFLCGVVNGLSLLDGAAGQRRRRDVGDGDGRLQRVRSLPETEAFMARTPVRQ